MGGGGFPAKTPKDKTTAAVLFLLVLLCLFVGSFPRLPSRCRPRRRPPAPSSRWHRRPLVFSCRPDTVRSGFPADRTSPDSACRPPPSLAFPSGSRAGESDRR